MIKAVYFKLLRILGQDRRMLARVRAENSLVVLNLHRISPEPNAFWAPMHPRVFEDLLLFVSEHFFVSTFAQSGANTTGRPGLVLSFDDGYADFVEYAVPLAARYGLRLNQNIIPTCAESGLPPWNIQLYDFLNQAPRALINEVRLPGFDHKLEGSDAASKARFGGALSRFLKNRPRAERAPLWSLLRPLVDQLPRSAITKMMTPAQIREVARTHEIGAHSFEHESMEFESNEYFQQDFQRCRDYFRDVLQLPLSVYAFPNGSHRVEQVEYLERSGIEHVLLIKNTYARPGSRRYARFITYADSRSEARLRATGYTRPLDVLKSWRPWSGAAPT